MLYETLRNYFSINSNGQLTVLYRMLLACLWPLQISWNGYDSYRKLKLLISNCKWQIGQLTNVLNMLYDSELRGISISQSILAPVMVPSITYESTVYAPSILSSTESSVLTSSIDNTFGVISLVTFNVPNDIYTNLALQTSLIGVIEQVKIQGITYKIVGYDR